MLLASCCIPVTAGLAQQAPCPPAPKHKLAAHLSTLKSGEYWLYNVTGTITLPSGAQPPGAGPAGPPGSGAPPSGPAPIAGTISQHIEVLPFQGKPTLAIVSVQDLTVGGAPLTGLQNPTQPLPTQILYVQQDPATKSILTIGDNLGPNGATRVATQPQPTTPGAWSTSTALDSTISWASGGSENVKLNVTGKATAATAIGDFEAWVTSSAITDSIGVTVTATEEWTPKLGAPVMFDTTTNTPDGTSLHTIGTLIKSSQVKSLYPVLADNLKQPRGLAFDPQGALWFTEAGVGGASPCIPFIATVNCFGNSGQVSRISDGPAKTVVDALGSLGTPALDQATGPNGIAFNSDGTPYVVVGNGGPQSATSLLGPQASQMGIVLSLNRVDKDVYTPYTVASATDFEYANNPEIPNQPDNRIEPNGTILPASNPFGLTSIGKNVYVADGGSHTVVQVTPDGTISLAGILPNQLVDVPAFPGGPVPSIEDSVPTGIIPAPDGDGLLVADYSGFPYATGSSRIFRVQAGQPATVFASGFTNLIGLAPAGDGGVYALEMARNGALSGNPEGALIHLAPSGEQDTVACHGLVYPTGIATGPDGKVYVSNYGTFGTNGEVVQIESPRENDDDSEN